MMMDDVGDEVETDAVHHRLSPGGSSSNKYHCYDCKLAFQSLTELLQHNPLHGGERCLKCSDPITVYFHASSSLFHSGDKKKVVRLHNCRRSQLRHQNSDLHFLALHVANQLDWLHDKNPSVILCETCESLTFPQTPSGVELFLVHSNSVRHNIVPEGCRTCSMPQFRAATTDGLVITTHNCITKDWQPSLKVRSK